MADESKLGTTIKAHCGDCGGTRNCEVKGFHCEVGGDEDFHWATEWFLLACRGCGFSFAQTVSTDSESYHDYYDRNGDHAQEYIETVAMWPAKAKRPVPDWFKHRHIEGNPSKSYALADALSELYRALNADLLVLSSIGIRTAFDAASEALGVKADLSFAEKLKALVGGGKILPSQKETVEVLIEAGSASAHRGWQPDAKQVDVQMDILEEFIYNSMVLPERHKKKADKIAELKNSVPKRAAKAKKPVKTTTPAKVT